MAQPTTAQPAVAAHREPSLVRGLSLTDSVMLLAGGIIGSGIFLTAGQIASAVHKPVFFLGVWLAGGLISLLACFAFAEMGAMFPEAGGQYVFLREAYGEFPAFLYGWMIFTVGQSGTIAALAVGFAEYFGAIVPLAAAHKPIATLLGFTLTRGHLVSIGAIILLTTINVLGVKRGSALINVATWAKFAAIGIFVLLGLAIGKGSWSNYAVNLPLDQPASLSHVISGFGVALIAVFWAYDGLVYVTWVSGEIKNPQRVLPRALLLGILLVGVIYVSVNVIYLYALPITQVANETTIAQAAAVTLFSSMGRVHPKYRTPAFSLIALSAWSVVLALSGSYDQLYTYVMFMMVLSYVAAVAALFVLRRKRPDVPRPYLCTGYPYLPALYLLMAGAWALNSVVTRPKETLVGIGIVFLGAPFYAFWRWQLKRHPEELKEFE